MNSILIQDLEKQKLKFYLLLVLWPLYLIFLPYVVLKLGFISVLFMIFPGLYLFTWLGFLMHETWHKYVKSIPNDLLFNIYSWMLFSDPQFYKRVHGYHHSKIHTWEDVEFHPLGKIENAHLRKIYNLMELALGIVFINLIIYTRFSKIGILKDTISRKKMLSSIALIAIFIMAVSMISHYTLNVPASTIFWAYIINLWLSSFFLHHSQLVEHGNIIVDGTFDERNIWTRNMSPSGILEKIFLFLTHGDSREHVLHHTLPSVYSRPFPGTLPMPEGSVYISIKDYLRIVAEMIIK